MRTLEATLDWSYQLLTEAELLFLLRLLRLPIFVGKVDTWSRQPQLLPPPVIYLVLINTAAGVRNI